MPVEEELAFGHSYLGLVGNISDKLWWNTLTHPNRVTVAAYEQRCLLPTEWGAWKDQDSQLSWQAPTFGNQDHFGFSIFKRILLNIISGPHGQMFAVCRKFLKCEFLFQNRATVLPLIWPQNHNAHGMDTQAFNRLWSCIPQSYMCWTDITGLLVLQGGWRNIRDACVRGGSTIEK